MTDAHPTISVVVPARNEGEHLVRSFGRILEELRSLDVAYELLAVDDGSTDDTWARLAELTRTDPSVRGIRLSRNFGKESAICAGLERARGEAVVVMDADLQHPPELIGRFYDAWAHEDTTWSRP